MILHQEMKSRRRAGFTLMEMLVVVAIIVALAGIGGYFLFGAFSEAKRDIAMTQTKVLGKACETYALKRNVFPDQLADLLKRDELGGPYLESADALLDPWNQQYQYDKTGTNNNGIRPDIWTIDPKDTNRTKLGNWPRTAQVR